MTAFAGAVTSSDNREAYRVRSVSPMHSLYEKMLFLHDMYRVRELPAHRLHRSTKHLYDIVQLYEGMELFGGRLDQRLLNKIRRHHNVWFGYSTTVFRSNCYSKLCFIPPIRLLGPLMDDYRKIRTEIIFDQSLDFPTIVGKIHRINERLNGIAWPYLDDDRRRTVISSLGK